MLLKQHTVIVLFIIITLYKINCASINFYTDIGKDPKGLKLKIRDESVNSNSSLEERSRNKRWIEETIKTPSGSPVSINTTEFSGGNCILNASLIPLYKYGKTGYKEYALVSSMVQKSKKNGCFKIKMIRKIENQCLWDMYKSRRENIMIETKTNDTNERLLFNGTVTANGMGTVWDIANKGFDERTAGVGPFGAGIYFTDSFEAADSKVIDKTCLSCRRKVILSRVILGKQKLLSSSSFYAHAPRGHHSVLGTQYGAAHDDYVVYRRDQTYPEYVITYETC